MYLGKPKGPVFRIISAILVFSFMTSFVLPKEALASRSRAGGGEIPEFSFSDFASTAGMSLGMFIAGQAVGGLLSAGAGDLWLGVKSSLGFGEQASSASWIMNAAANSAATGAVVPGELADLGSSIANNMGSAENIFTTFPAEGLNLGRLDYFGDVAFTALDGSTLAAPEIAAVNITQKTAENVGTLSKMGNAFMNPFRGIDKFGITMIKGYNTFVATSQVARAVGTMGAYYEWNPRTTYVLSAVSVGLTSGLLNPDLALAKQGIDPNAATSILSPQIDTTSFLNLAKGAFVGGLQQGASSLAIVAIDGSKIAKGKSPGAVAQLSGLIAGTMAGNFARELVNPSPELLKIFEKIDEPQKTPGPIQDQEKQVLNALREPVYGEITQAGGNNKFGAYYTKDGVNNFIDSNSQENGSGAENIKAITEKGITRIYNIDPGINASGLFNATVIKTLDMWPVFAGKGMGYLAADMLGNGLTDEEKNKRPLATLARGLTETVFTSIFSGAASAWDLRASRYIGRDVDIVNQRLAYVDSVVKAGWQKRMENYKSELDDNIVQLKEKLHTGQIDQITYDNQVKDKANELARIYGFIKGDKELPLFTSGVIRSNESKDIAQDMKSKVDGRLELSDKDYENSAEALKKNIKEINTSENFVRNQAINFSGKFLEANMKYDGADLAGKLDIARVDKFDLFVGKVKDGSLLGLFESGIKSGVQAAFQSKARLNQQSESYNYMNALMVSSLTNVGMGIVRGVAWNLGWEPNSADSYWYQGKELVKVRPEAPKEESFSNDLLGAKDREFAYAKYDGEMKLYKDFLERSGVREEPARNTKDELTGGWQAKVGFEKSSAPSLGAAIGMSIKQATLESFVGGFSFGMPLTRPDSVSSLQFLQYTNVLKSKASQVNNINTGGFTRALADFAVDANLSATANSLLGTMAQVKPLRDFVGIAPERLVQTNAPGIPYTLQYSQKTPGLANYDSKWYLKYPDPLASIKSRDIKR